MQRCSCCHRVDLTVIEVIEVCFVTVLTCRAAAEPPGRFICFQHVGRMFKETIPTSPRCSTVPSTTLFSFPVLPAENHEQFNSIMIFYLFYVLG